MKASKIMITILLVAALAIVAWRLKTREAFWSPVNFTSPPLPLLMRGYTGSYVGAVLPTNTDGEAKFEYTTLPFTWSRV